ncbi:hypothetical protein CALCODRAFT_269048 [Calocera cornea HHB12733]|uniref:Uncharacterized protein n=1 Tax=Calocera cornea HHB12733 TaxID=1353952 RepID=A0A165G7U8_9BASI|nr:hypothetical protein CALCODRAFT_269048 [Calocera cornea HHB12733]
MFWRLLWWAFARVAIKKQGEGRGRIWPVRATARVESHDSHPTVRLDPVSIQSYSWG